MTNAIRSHQELNVPEKWDFMEMDSRDVPDNGHVEDIVSSIREAGLRVFITGVGKIRVGQRKQQRDSLDSYANEFFKSGIAPSLLDEGFTDIRFVRADFHQKSSQ